MAKKADIKVETGITPGSLETGTWNGRCMKCKEQKEFAGVVVVTPNGRRMAKGPCTVCNTTICRILGKDQ